MATLYEINKSIEQVLETGFAFDEETGEIYFTEDDLESLQLDLRTKLENCGLWIKNQNALANSIREEEKKLADRRRAIEKRTERLETYMAYVMSQNDMKALETPTVALKATTSKRVYVWNEDVLPECYLRKVEKVSVDKKAITEAIKNGEEVYGASLEEYNGVSVK